MNIEQMLKMLRGVKTAAVTCLQFGDTGKGKIVDLLAVWAALIIRSTGGSNAGHSVYLNGEKYIFHLVPSGILHDRDGKTNIVGSGAAVDPRIFCEELALLRQQGLPYDHLMVSLNAKLTLPTQVVRDRVGEGDAGAGRIGTTGRGIGPTYGDHTIRIGLTVNDLLNPDILAANVRKNVAFSVRILSSYDPDMVKSIIHQTDLGAGMYYSPDPKKMFDVDVIVQQYLEYGKILKDLIRDTDTFVLQSVGRLNLLLEGAQGGLLDVDYGTRPFVTSSNCTIDGLTKGTGLNRSHVDLALGVVKGFYETRVGLGPFPTELGGEASDKWCNSRAASREKEEADYPDVSVNDKDELRQGVAIRRVGQEFGATTKRSRRVGWLDLPLLRCALLHHKGADVVLTKLDVLDEVEEIRVCERYEYVGPTYRHGSLVKDPGSILEMAIPAAEVLYHCKPIYRTFPGWKRSLKGITAFGDLPQELKTILDFVVLRTGINPRIISVGAGRDETIFV